MTKQPLIAFEGIPGGGKTSIFLDLAARMPSLFLFIPEIVEQFDPLKDLSIDVVLKNDREKYKIASRSELPVIMDRSYVSSINWDFVLKQQGKQNRFNEKIKSVNKMKEVGELYPADYYFLFNISPSTSLKRKQLPIRDNLAWSTEKSLAIAITYYFEYFKKAEAQSKVITIDAGEDFNVVLSNVVRLLTLILEGKL